MVAQAVGAGIWAFGEGGKPPSLELQVLLEGAQVSSSSRSESWLQQLGEVDFFPPSAGKPFWVPQR